MSALPDLSAVALDIARRGFYVFPLVPDGKTPSVPWRELSTNDPDWVSDWPPGDNVAIDTGKSGLVVVDVDVKRGDGFKPWKDLLKRNGLDDWPGTFTVRTASGGAHFYFRADNHEIRNSASLIADHVDIRAVGGYVVAPGSVVGGTAYTILYDAPLLPLPDWLAEAATAPGGATRPDRAGTSDGDGALLRKTMSARAVERTVNGILDTLATAAPGERNHELFKAACRLFEFVDSGRIADDYAEDALTEAAEMNGLADDGRHAVRATIASARRAVS
jgi:hypothetical protein